MTANNEIGTLYNDDGFPKFNPKYGIISLNTSSFTYVVAEWSKYLTFSKLAIGSKAKEVYFTSCGSESDNLAIKGFCYANKNKGKHIITTKIEHRTPLGP